MVFHLSLACEVWFNQLSTDGAYLGEFIPPQNTSHVKLVTTTEDHSVISLLDLKIADRALLLLNSSYITLPIMQCEFCQQRLFLDIAQIGTHQIRARLSHLHRVAYTWIHPITGSAFPEQAAWHTVHSL